MNKPTHFELTCTKGHLWHEPIPTKKTKPGEHRTCPICGGSSWIAADAPLRSLASEHAGKVIKTRLNVKAHISLHGGGPAAPLAAPGEFEKVAEQLGLSKRIPIPTDLIPKHAAPEEQKVVTEKEYTGEDTWKLEEANSGHFWGGSNTSNTW